MGVLQTLVPIHLSLVRRSTENSTEDGLDHRRAVAQPHVHPVRPLADGDGVVFLADFDQVDFVHALPP